jgi:glycosyltransferase involved in cell wall biosynthesis
VRLSVVIPCYNEVRTIDKLLAAVRASPHRDIEVILVDDGSKDGTRERLSGELRPLID